MTTSKISSMVMAVMMIAGLLQSVSAVTHTVTWTFGTNATEYDEWASRQTFQVDDVIQFMYDSAHNVFEVSKADLDSCNVNNPIEKYETVNANVTLARSGYFGFICGIPGHCSSGNMKMNVQVSAATTPSPPSSTPPTESTTPPPTSSTPPKSSNSDSPVPAPAHSDASSLQYRSAMVLGTLVAGCAAVLL